MLLLKEVVRWGPGELEALVDPRDSHVFIDADGRLPVWVGIEYMAQAIGALAGIAARQEGEPIRLGFLLGTRRYQADVSHFDLAQELRVCVTERLRDETNLVLFNGELYAGTQRLAQAEIKAIQPRDIDAVMGQFMQMNALAGE